MTTAEEGGQFMWWAHEKSKVAEGGKISGEGVGIWFYKFSKVIMDEYRLLMILESEFDPAAQQLRATAYQWV